MELGRIQQTTSPPPSVPVVDTSSQASLEDGQEQPRGQSGPALTGSRPATTSSPVKEIAPKMSCCYGLMVFLGLTVSLLALTLLVVYVGVLSHQSLYGNFITSIPSITDLFLYYEPVYIKPRYHHTQHWVIFHQKLCKTKVHLE